MTILEIIIAVLHRFLTDGMCICATVAVNSVCASEQRTCEI